MICPAADGAGAIVGALSLPTLPPFFLPPAMHQILQAILEMWVRDSHALPRVDTAGAIAKALSLSSIPFAVIHPFSHPQWMRFYRQLTLWDMLRPAGDRAGVVASNSPLHTSYLPHIDYHRQTSVCR